MKELRTIGECLDALLRGDLLFLGDVLMQRMKAIEQATKDGNWTLAQHLELIDSCDVGLATDREKEEAMQAELLAKIVRTQSASSARLASAASSSRRGWPRSVHPGSPSLVP